MQHSALFVLDPPLLYPGGNTVAKSERDLSIGLAIDRQPIVSRSALVTRAVRSFGGLRQLHPTRPITRVEMFPERWFAALLILTSENARTAELGGQLLQHLRPVSRQAREEEATSDTPITQQIVCILRHRFCRHVFTRQPSKGLKIQLVRLDFTFICCLTTTGLRGRMLACY